MLNLLYTPDSNRSQSCLRQTILVVESHPTIAELLSYCLDFAGYYCSVVNASQIASLTWVDNSLCPSPDGIILDVDIRSVAFKGPLDFFQAFCVRWQTVFTYTQMPPLLLLTAQPNICSMLQEYAVVMKPFKPVVLMSNLQALLMERQRRAENFEAKKVLPNNSCVNLIDHW
jgi:DNA-binding response OmpR family regulator